MPRTLLADFFYVLLFAAVPVWLGIRAWRGYRSAITKDTSAIRSALSIYAISLALFVAIVALVILDEHSPKVRRIESLVPSPGKVAWLCSLLSLGSLLVARRVPTETQESRRTRRRIIVADIYLALAALLIFSVGL
jgi:hypothetical protein